MNEHPQTQTSLIPVPYEDLMLIPVIRLQLVLSCTSTVFWVYDPSLHYGAVHSLCQSKLLCPLFLQSLV